MSAGASLYPHTDTKYIPELGERPVIAAVSFGEPRDFVLTRIDDKSKKITLPLQHGDLFVMFGDSQQEWKHSIPEMNPSDWIGSRISLTYRHHPIKEDATVS